MAVQNHDAALNEKELLVKNLKRARCMVSNLEDRVRQLEAALSLESEPCKTWSRDQLQTVLRAFEKSFDDATETHGDSAAPASHSASHAAGDDLSAEVAGTSRLEAISFRSDYFCSWLCTDPDARCFDVKCRAHAAACGAALLAHQVIARSSCASLALAFLSRAMAPTLCNMKPPHSRADD